jgi:uncharacterized membrane protein (UPF0182 family)
VRTVAFQMPDEGDTAGPDTPGKYAARSAARARTLIVAMAVLVMLGMAFVMFSGFFTDWLWYRSVHYSSVFSTTVRTRVALFGAFGLTMACAVGVTMYLAYRLRPPLSAMSVEERGLDRYRMGIAPFRRWLLLAVCVLVGLIAGASASNQWRTWLAYANAVPFGTRDPRFKLDVSFYTFQLPWYRFLLSFGFATVVLCLVSATLVHYLYGGLRMTSPGSRATSAATGHLSFLLGLFVSLKAVAYWLDRYGLAVKSSGLKATTGWTGLRYVDANAYLPAKTILFCIAIICALLFYATLWRRTWSLPMLGLALMALSAILIGGLYPAIVQKFQVQPDEAAKEAPYLRHNIDATRTAFGIAGTKVTDYPGTSQSSGATLRSDIDTAAGLRVLDPGIVAPTFQQLQQDRGYYSFSGPLTVDRYEVDGREQDTVVGVREIDESAIPGNNWINDHFRYTHGYGVVTADASTTTDIGAPAFTESDLPPTGALGAYQPRIYYGRQTTQYAIVDGPTPELDYPGRNGSEQTYRYTGDSGVSLAGPLTRAAYAVRFGQPQILYSDAIGKDSRILYDRTPAQRVSAVAPWLTLDGHPYPAVVDGHIEWIIDGYTTSDAYPYSSRTTLDGTAADSPTDGGPSVGARSNQVNYIRDAVKATVDAYTGKVTLYQWDTTDPVLKTWMKAFPGTVLPRTDIPAALMSHLRYPQDLFTLQRRMLTRYHVTDTAAFFSGSETWQVPDDPTKKDGGPVAPYYLSLTMPGRSGPVFSLATTLTPAGRDTLGAFVAVDSDATSPDYGTIRVLRLPTDSDVAGPRQVQSRFDSDRDVADEINVLKKNDSEIEYGDLLTIPLDGGLVYVEPVYVRGAGTDYPLLKEVLVTYGDATALEPTLGAALDEVFGTALPGAPPPPAGSSDAAGAAVRKALAQAQSAFDAGRKDLAAGDWTSYGKDQRALAAALRRAKAAAHP